MSNSSRGQKKYSQKMQRPSRVLLICVYDTVVFQIKGEQIRQKFQKFGNITKLLIFEKSEVTKMFLEYEDIDSAIRAKQQLDGTKLLGNICKMTIYFSNFNNVDLKHQSATALAPPEYKAKHGHDSEEGAETKSSNRQKELYTEFFDQDETFRNLKSSSIFSRSKTDNPKTLKQQIAKMSMKQDFSEIIDEEDEMEQSIKKSIESILQPSYSQMEEERREVKETAVKMKEQTDVRSSIVWFSYKYSLQPEVIYNLFSNFGNISCIVVKKQQVYIKFRTKQFAAIACTYLNNTILNGNHINLRQCEESSKWRPQEGEASHCMYYDSSFDRFTAQRSITINPPSHTLHVSSIKREMCKEHCLRDIFEEFGEIERVQILQQSNQRNMALIRLRTLEQSFNALVSLHNKSFNGRKMQISFTKSKV